MSKYLPLHYFYVKEQRKLYVLKYLEDEMSISILTMTLRSKQIQLTPRESYSWEGVDDHEFQRTGSGHDL